MSALLYFAGIICGLALFLYLLSAYHAGKDGVRRLTGKAEPAPEPRNTNGARPSIFALPPGERMCPICRTKLAKNEPLYASKVSADGTSKILVHGCRYCYKES